jgi:hypothetical protein
MQWDLGPLGLGLLAVMSIGFGFLAHLLAGRTATRWLWLVVAAVYFLVGLLTSEMWFGWATEEELRPNVDGLSFDEVLLIGLAPVAVAVLISRYLGRRRGRSSRPPTGTQGRV